MRIPTGRHGQSNGSKLFLHLFLHLINYKKNEIHPIEMMYFKIDAMARQEENQKPLTLTIFLILLFFNHYHLLYTGTELATFLISFY